MASRDLDTNIKIIRGNSSVSDQNVGSTVREAIASAIEQEDALYDARVKTVHNEVVNQDVRMSVSNISGQKYRLTIINS